MKYGDFTAYLTKCDSKMLAPGFLGCIIQYLPDSIYDDIKVCK